MGGGGIHMQLPYTVINVWRINMWRGHSRAATIHSTNIQRVWWEHCCVTTIQLVATMQLSVATIQLLVAYQIRCGYHITPGWIPDSVWLPYNSCVTTIQLPCGAP